MKKLRNIQSNSDRLMKTEELMSLWGGFDDTTGCFEYGWIFGYCGKQLGDT